MEATEAADVSPQPVEPMIEAPEVARLLSVSRAWVYKAADEGRIPHYRIGTRVRFRVSEIEDWLAREGAQHPQPAAV